MGIEDRISQAKAFVDEEPGPVWGVLRDAANEIQRLRAEVKRLRSALREAAEMTEHEADRTLIYNHCMDARGDDIGTLEDGAERL